MMRVKTTFVGFFVALLFASTQMFGQLSGYTFSTPASTFAYVSGYTTATLSGNADDGWVNGLPIGFTFNYDGTNYTAVNACTDGFLSFTTLSSSWPANTGSGSVATGTNRPAIVPLWDDLLVGSIRYVTTGSAPNRVFTAEWNNTQWDFLSAVAITFQVKLYETSNVIDFIYKQEAGAVSTSAGGATIGLSTTATGAGNYWSLPNSGAAPTPSSSTDVSNITTKPATNQAYRWTPPSSGPANNDCAGAITLTPNSSCSYIAGSSASATQSLAGCTGNADDDVWYKFIASATTATVTIDGGADFDPAFELRSGACNGTQIAGSCTDVGGTGGVETYAASGLTIGSTYYIRVWDFAAGSGSFDICVISPGVSNDNCSGAITLAVNSSCSYTAGTSSGATQSLAGCSGNADDDVWYKFVATATTHTVTVAPSASYDAAFEVRSGACNGTQIAGTCTDGPGNGGTETRALSGLTVGATYYIRVWNFDAGSGSSTFNICVFGNGCGVSISFQPQSSCAVVGGTATFSLTATGSPTYQWQVNTGSGFSNIVAAGSNPTYSGYTSATLGLSGIVAGNNNYQYQCVCTNGCSTTSTNVSLFVSGAAAPAANAASGVSSSGFTANWSSSSGANGYYLDVAYDNAFTVMVLPGYYNLDVGNVLSKAVTGLTCGTTYYYRVRAYNACGPSMSSNTITSTTSACTNNDECSTAINLTVGNGSSCSSPWYTTAFATASAQASCTGSPDDDVWFTFTAPTATVTIDVGASYNFDAAFELLSGTCPGALTSLGCRDMHPLYGGETMTFSTLTPATVYYVRVYNWRAGAGSGGFTICLSNPQSYPLSPNNDAQAGAITLADHDCYPRNAINWALYNTTGSTNSGEPALPTCWTPSLTVNKTTWFKFTATTTAQMITTDWDHTIGGVAYTDNRIAVYTSGLSLIGCNEDRVYVNGTSKGGDFEHWYYPFFGTTANFSGITVTGLTVGNVYYVRVDSPDGVLSICTEPAPSNDACATSFDMTLNVDYFVNNTGASLFSNDNVPDAVFDCTGGESTDNLLYFKFTPLTTDMYYINQWSQYADIGYGTQFVIFDPTYNCATIPNLTTGTNIPSQILCSPSSLANRSYSVTLTAGSTYNIIIDGGQADEALFHFAISKGTPYPMPVELLSFNALCDDDKVIAAWTTASETNNDYFVLENSSDGTNFTPVTTVKGAGNSSTQNHYKAFDYEVGNAQYYRIKQVDYNGEFSYSNTVFTPCRSQNGNFAFTVINPVTDGNIQLSFTGLKENELLLVLTDVFGREVYSKLIANPDGGYFLTLNPDQRLSPGVYFITASSNDKYISKKIVVK